MLARMSDDIEVEEGTVLCREGQDIPRTATVRAKTPLRLFVLTRRDFRRLVDDSPSVERKMMRSLARRLVELSNDPALC